MIMTRDEVEKLIAELVKASEVYNHEMADAIMDDAEFDAKSALLEEINTEPEFADLFAPNTPGWGLLDNEVAQGTSITDGNAIVIVHKHPMLSLGKAKKEKAVVQFVNRLSKAGVEVKDLRLQAKLDGFAMSATYRNGQLVQLATRGNGFEGEDVTYLTHDPMATIVGLPLAVDDDREIEIRGELFFTAEQFQNVSASRVAQGGEPYDKDRNAVVGLMKRSKLGQQFPVSFTFATYSLLVDGQPADLTELDTVTVTKGSAIVSVDALTAQQVKRTKLNNFDDFDDFMKAIHSFGEERDSFTIPTDGVVIKPVREAELLAKMGATSHHPSSQIAFKYPEVTVDTEVVDITVTVGAKGKLTPRAEVRPVRVPGSLITYATLNNFGHMYEKGVMVGSQVRIRRANDVIPEVLFVIHNPENGKMLEVPTVCPSCDTDLEWDHNVAWPPRTLTCPNYNCPSRDFFALKNAVGKTVLDIDGLGPKTLERLNEAGLVTTLADLYLLTKEQLASLSKSDNDADGGEKVVVVDEDATDDAKSSRNLGEAMAEKILKHLERSKTLPLHRQMVALNIPGMQLNTARRLVAHYGSLEAIMAADVDDMAMVEKMGTERAKKIVAGFAARADLVEKLRAVGFAFAPVNNDTTSAQQGGSGAPKAVEGLSFAISGPVPEPFGNRNDWVDWVLANGGNFDSSPKATTSFMVADATGSSSKVKAAQRLGLTFITAEEFTAKFVK